MALIKLRSWLLFLTGAAILGCVSAKSAPCDLRDERYGKVCVCTADYCDFLDDPTPEDEDKFVVVTSSKAGLRLDTTEGEFNVAKKHFVLDFDEKPSSTEKEETTSQSSRESNTQYVRLNVNRENQHQTIVGFGGALTGAVAYLLNLLPQALQDQIYKSYYAEYGNGYNLMRISIGGCDFDLEPWAYNETPENDVELTNFTLDPRDELRIEKIKRLKEVTEIKNLRIKGAAWSPPPWMKTNNDWTGRSRLKEEYYQTWANYHLKWLEMMKENGVPIWAISTGNEPVNGVAYMLAIRFMSLGWIPNEQANWIADNLGPTIRDSKFKDLVILSNDDNRLSFPVWFDEMNRTRADSLDYINGLAVHWYFDDFIPTSFVDSVHVEMPDKIMIMSESCAGSLPWERAEPLLGSWERGEQYARSYLEYLQHDFNGWIDWNILLDENGGPNYVNNFVDAPIIVNLTNTNEVFKQPMFYTMGHFTKFAPENSVRIESVRSNDNIDSVAFLRPDGTVAVVLYNSANANVEITVVDSERGTIVVNVPQRSINTFIYR